MAYFNQERKAEKAPIVKAICKKYGVKASLAVRHHSTVVLNVKSASIDFIANYNETVQKIALYRSQNFNAAVGSIQVNPYHFKDHFTGKALKFLTEIFDTLKGDGWYDNSDMQTDYFDTAWYVDVNIGSWNKPFLVTA